MIDKPRTITEHEMAASDLYSAASCALSTLRGLNVAEGGRIQFIEGVLKKHSRYAPKLESERDKADAALATHLLKS